MSTFSVPVLAIDDVYDHPQADRLSIIRVRGYEAISAKLDDGSHRFGRGELIAYVPEGAVVPEEHLKARGFWNAEKNCGMLAGREGDRVKAIRLRGVLSQGLVWQAAGFDPEDGSAFFAKPDGAMVNVNEGDDLADFFDIEKYVAPIPASMGGKLAAVFEAAYSFDIENLKHYPDLLTGCDVVVTEKLHGTCARMTYLGESFAPRDDLFGDGRVAITSKGYGAAGLVFTNVAENAGNVYVAAFTPLIDRFVAYCREHGPKAVVHLMGEVFGPGVQDLHYGVSERTLRAFDLIVSNEGVEEEEKAGAFEEIGVTRVPVLHRGPFDRALIDRLVDGKTTLGAKLDGAGPHIREGIVITASGSQAERETAYGGLERPCLKHVSADYLTRKGGTELQ